MKENNNGQLIMSAMRRMKNIKLTKICDELPEGETMLLNTISMLEMKNDKAAVSEIVPLIHMHATAVSRLMKNLEDKGIIVRSIDPNNHRNIIVSTTEKGKEVNKKNHEKIKRFWENVFQKIPDDDISELVRVWNEVMDVMEENLKEYDKDR